MIAIRGEVAVPEGNGLYDCVKSETSMKSQIKRESWTTHLPCVIFITHPSRVHFHNTSKEQTREKKGNHKDVMHKIFRRRGTPAFFTKENKVIFKSLS